MRGNWIKIVMFVLAAFMLAGITQVMLDPGLGKPDESRRTKHPAGFSFIPPGGWGGSVFYPPNPTVGSLLRVSPEKSTGRQPVIGVTRYSEPPRMSEPQTPFTFQGQPAKKMTLETYSSWTWRIDFEREGVSYSIAVTYPLRTPIETGPLWPFIESFRVEPVIDLSAATTIPAPASIPTTGPTTR